MLSCLNPHVSQRMTHTQLYIPEIKFKKEKKINKRKKWEKEKVKKKNCFDGEEHNVISTHCGDEL